MKYKKIILLLSISFLASFFVGCKDMDTTYKEYVVVGGITYAGKPKDVRAYPGRYRVALKWAKGADPKLKFARVFWNNYKDSINVTINPQLDTVQVEIKDLKEQDYSFFVRSYDQAGNASVPVEVITRTYGENFETNISTLNRGLINAEINASDKITMKWGPANSTLGAYATEVKYTDKEGKEKKAVIKVKQGLLEIADYKTLTPLEFRTLYLPDSLSLDTFYTNYSQVGLFHFAKTGWQIVGFSSQHDAGSNGVKNFIDGTDATRWHSMVGGVPYPHFATIDLGKEKTIGRISLWRTTFENGGDVRGPDKVQFMVSNDNQNWTDLGKFNFNTFINGEQKYEIPSLPSARYVKFIGLSGPQAYIVMGEISVYVK